MKEDKLIHNYNTPIAWMAGNKVAANLLMMLLIIGGVIVFTQTTQEIFPAFDTDTVTVSVSYPGSSPEEVEKSIILALEDGVKDIDGIGEISSTASEGSARVMVEIIDTDERIRVAQDIKSAVDRISSFPEDAEEPVVTLMNRRRGVVTLALYGDADERTLNSISEQVYDKFTQNSEIGPVEIAGSKDHEVQVVLSSESLRRYNMTLADISAKIKSIAIEVPGGTLETSSGDILIRLTERRDSSADFATIPIKRTANGNVLRLGDIAEIKRGFAEDNSKTAFDGKPSILIEVYRAGDQTPISVASAVKQEIEDLNKTLPGNIRLSIVHDRSKVFKQRANLLINNGILGLFLVVIFLGLFLDIKVALWVSMGIPISFGGAFLLFPATDFSVNLVSMFAFIISLGIVVDDAIVVGENVYSHRQKGMSPLDAAIIGAKEVAVPVFFSVATNIVAFIPLFFVPGIMGKVFRTIPVVVICVFSISLLECLFILPAHLRLKKKAKKKDHGILATLIRFQRAFNNKFESFVNVRYKRFLEMMINNRYGIFVIAVGVLVMAYSYAFSGRMGMVLFPRVESDYAFGKVTLPLGTPKEKVEQVMKKITDAADRVIAQYPEGTLSRGVYGRVKSNSIESRIFLTDPDVRPISTKEVTKKWKQEVGVLVGIESSSFVSNRGGPGFGAALTVELSHSDSDILSKAGEALAKKIEDFSNTSDVNDGTASGKVQFDITVNDYGYAVGLTSSEIARQIRASIYGLDSIRQQDGLNEVTVNLKLPDYQRNTETDLDNVIIRTSFGKKVRLKDVVNVKKGRAFTSISRRNNRRIIQVTADVTPPSQAGLIKETLQEDALPQLKEHFPGLTYSFEGKQADMMESIIALGIGFIVVLAVIFSLIAILFKSYTQPIMVMIAIPFSAIGAVLGHIIMGYPMSIMSLFGLLALTGVVVNDSIVLIEFANREIRAKERLKKALMEASVRRFRPIMLTTVTTFVGLAPMMFETSRQARFLIPMAISLGFGIIVATLITLILIPVLYVIIDDIKGLFSVNNPDIAAKNV